jgi:hypothetical protein
MQASLRTRDKGRRRNRSQYVPPQRAPVLVGARSEALAEHCGKGKMSAFSAGVKSVVVEAMRSARGYHGLLTTRRKLTAARSPARTIPLATCSRPVPSMDDSTSGE